MLVYEYPLNERARIYLRLENLFERLGVLLARDSALDHHFALVTIFEIIEVGARSDLKSEILKDLEKHKQLFNSYRGNPAIEESALNEVIGHIEQAYANLNGQPGKAGMALNDNEWIVSVRGRIGIPAGTCEFDLPAYYHWQQHSADKRREDLMRWASTLLALVESVKLLLKLMRDTGSPQMVIAVNGQYEQVLPQGRGFQLMRLRIDPSQGFIPAISGNKLMVSVRILREVGMDKVPVVSAEDASFEVTLCA